MTEQELRLELISYARELAETCSGIALIVDEAHLLGEHILEELRALTNFVSDSRPLFRVMLSGQLSLEDLLTQRSLSAVNQRLTCHATLERLTKQESLEYLMTRTLNSGGQIEELMSDEALQLIVEASDGLPRCLNQLADHALALACVEKVPTVQESHIREALNDLQKLPLHWNVSLPTPDPISELKPSELRSPESNQSEFQQPELYSSADESIESSSADESNESFIEFDTLTETATNPELTAEVEPDNADQFELEFESKTTSQQEVTTHQETEIASDPEPAAKPESREISDDQKVNEIAVFEIGAEPTSKTDDEQSPECDDSKHEATAEPDAVSASTEISSGEPAEEELESNEHGAHILAELGLDTTDEKQRCRRSQHADVERT